MFKIISMTIIIFLSLPQANAMNIAGKVLAIHDGDTLTLLPSGETKKVKLRLLGVDTPEIDFNGFSQGEVAIHARDFLKSLLPINANIKIELAQNGTDSNGRYLGIIIYEGRDLNAQILEAGWGVAYFIFPYDKSLVVNYLKLSQDAYLKSLGIFSNQFKHERLPYLFRQESKGIPGTNLVGNFTTKKIFSSENIEEIPVYNRVFFPSEQMAKSVGFSW